MSLDNAMTDAEKIGKSRALCETNSSFEISLSNCQACVIAHTNETGTNLTSENQRLPQFEPFLDYCTSITNGSSADAAQKALIASQVSQASVISSLQDDISMAASLGLLSSYQSTKVVTTTASPSPISVPTSVATITSAQTTPSREPQPHKSHATIAGAVVGPILGLLLSSIVCWFLLRRWKRRAARYVATNLDDKDSGNFDNKAQLHSDSINPRCELADNADTHELEGCAGTKPTMSELPALEIVGSEMDVPEGLVKRGELPK